MENNWFDICKIEDYTDDIHPFPYDYDTLTRQDLIDWRDASKKPDFEYKFIKAVKFYKGGFFLYWEDKSASLLPEDVFKSLRYLTIDYINSHTRGHFEIVSARGN